MEYLRRKRAGGLLLAVGALVALTMFVVLPALAFNPGDFEPPASGTYGITPVLIANGGQNNDCEIFYNVAGNGNGTYTVGGKTFHEFYVNNPKNTTTATDPATGASFTFTVDSRTNALTRFSSTGAAIVDVGIKGGTQTTRYNYDGTVPQPSTYPGPFPGTVTNDTSLHPPISGTDKQGNPLYYTISHTGFCYSPIAAISGTAFTDSDGDGSQVGSTETGLAGLAVTVTNAGGTSVGTGTTVASGAYSVTVPQGGPYKVCIQQPSSTKETVPTSTTAGNATCSTTGQAQYGYSATVGSSGVSGLNFGFQSVASITVNAFIDNNGNGSNDSGDSAASTGVQLFDVAGNAIGLQQTTTGGTYTFNNLPVGQTYKVCVVTPSGGSYNETAPTSSTTNHASCTGSYASVGYSYTSFSANQTANFGFVPVGSLSGTVYQDVNGPKGGGADGAFESGTDTPLLLWTVTLYDQSGNPVGSPATSDASGHYSITASFDSTQTYKVCVTPFVATGPWGQSEPLPTSANNCTQPDLLKGQTFQPSGSGATVTENFGVAPAVGEGTCPPPEVFGSDQTNGVLQIKLAACKPNQTFVFDTEPNVPWVSVWASDQTQPLVPLIEKIVFPDPIVDGVPTLQHIAYTDAFPYDPSAAVQMPFCKLDPRDPSDASGMTLASAFKPDSTKSQVLPNDIGTTTPATSCAISIRTYVDASGNGWLEAFAYSDIDGLTKGTG